MLKPVVQQDLTGCAIASVAVLSGLPYASVKAAAKKIGIEVLDPKNWSRPEPMRALLKAHCVSAGAQRPFLSWANLPDRALLAVKWHLEPTGPAWHWVVFSREGGDACVFDSKRALKAHRRTDFGRIKPKWYIPIVANKIR